MTSLLKGIACLLLVLLSQGCLSFGLVPEEIEAAKQPLGDCLKLEDAHIEEDCLVLRVVLADSRVATLDVVVGAGSAWVTTSLREGSPKELNLSEAPKGRPIRVSNDYAWLDSLSADTPVGMTTNMDEIELCWDNRLKSIKEIYILNKDRQFVGVIEVPETMPDKTRRAILYGLQPIFFAFDVVLSPVYFFSIPYFVLSGPMRTT